jgi:hypothetical protein
MRSYCAFLVVVALLGLEAQIFGDLNYSSIRVIIRIAYIGHFLVLSRTSIEISNLVVSGEQDHNLRKKKQILNVYFAMLD